MCVGALVKDRQFRRKEDRLLIISKIHQNLVTFGLTKLKLKGPVLSRSFVFGRLYRALAE